MRKNNIATLVAFSAVSAVALASIVGPVASADYQLEIQSNGDCIIVSDRDLPAWPTELAEGPNEWYWLDPLRKGVEVLETRLEAEEDIVNDQDVFQEINDNIAKYKQDGVTSYEQGRIAELERFREFIQYQDASLQACLKGLSGTIDTDRPYDEDNVFQYLDEGTDEASLEELAAIGSTAMFTDLKNNSADWDNDGTINASDEDYDGENISSQPGPLTAIVVVALVIALTILANLPEIRSALGI